MGFTLIELSVVLVIIGLVVGGVLVGRDLIRAATTRSQIKQIQDLQTQVATFVIKYNCLPGDCSNSTTYLGVTDAGGHTIVNGDGDGLIRSTVGSGSPYVSGECAMGNIRASELPQAFLQLDDSGISTYLSDGTGNAMNSGWGPVQAIDNGTGLLVTCISNPTWSFTPLDPGLSNTNIIVLGAFPDTTNTRIVYAVGLASVGGVWAQSGVAFPLGIPIGYAREIDQKMDDGLPASGAVGVIGAPQSNAYNGASTPCLTSSNTAYPASFSSCTATVGVRLGM